MLRRLWGQDHVLMMMGVSLLQDKQKHEAFVQRKKQRSGWQSGNDKPRPKFDSQLPGETYRKFANR